jgi:carbonic anhydrase
MSRVLTEILEANAKYVAEFGERAKLATPPTRRVAVLTCMDARLDPAKFLGLSEGDAHVIRNAGGRASEDAIRSLVISYKLLGTKEFFVIHHNECGMLSFTDEVMNDLLASSLEPAQLTPDGFKDVGKGPGSQAGKKINWLTFKDQRQAVLDDVAYIRNHPLVPKTIPVYGYIFDVKSGKINEVEGAKALGAVGK